MNRRWKRITIGGFERSTGSRPGDSSMTESLRGRFTDSRQWEDDRDLPGTVTLRCEICDGQFTIRRAEYVGGRRTCSEVWLHSPAQQRPVDGSLRWLLAQIRGVATRASIDQVATSIHATVGRRRSNARRRRMRSEPHRATYNWQRYQDNTEFRERKKAHSRAHHNRLKARGFDDSRCCDATCAMNSSTLVNISQLQIGGVA